MINQKGIELIVGTVASIGGVILLLSRFNLIRFGKKECLNTCRDHNEIVNKLNDIQSKQNENIKLHEIHAEKFTDGKKQFDKVHKSLTKIGESVAVLLDRTGGRPKGL